VKKPQFKLDSEFMKLLPPQTADERKKLRELLKTEGCRDPLIVWMEEDLLVDGHNRYAICEEEGIAYEVKFVSFTSREHVKFWMLQTQFGRRNVVDKSRTYLLGQWVKLEASTRDGRSKLIAAATVAKEAGVSERTARRAADLTDAVDKIAGDDVAKRQKVLTSGKSAADIIVQAKLCERHQRVGPPPARFPCADCAEARGERTPHRKYHPAKPAVHDPVKDDMQLLLNAFRTVKRVGLKLVKGKAGAAFMRLARSYNLPIVFVERGQAPKLEQVATWPMLDRFLEMVETLKKCNIND
jgi:hypothetical protein